MAILPTDENSKDFVNIMSENDNKIDFYTNEEEIDKLFKNLQNKPKNEKIASIRSSIKKVFKINSETIISNKKDELHENVIMLDNNDLKSIIKRT